MNSLMKVLTLGAVLAASAPLAFATSITIESYGSDLNNGPTPAGAANTAMTFNPVASQTSDSGSTGTFDIPTVAPWASLGGTTSWISYDSGTWVGGPTVAPTGNYVYDTTFTGALGDTGSITVLADDTTSVYLNGTLITPQAPAVAATNCTMDTPNCVQAATYTLSGFTGGTNTLQFVVAQDFGSATGLDFVGTVNSGINSNVSSTPEPSSLLLLGTGLVGAAGTLLRRRRLTA